LHLPLAVGRCDGLQCLRRGAVQVNGDGFTRFCPAPDGNRFLALQNGVVGKNAGKTKLGAHAEGHQKAEEEGEEAFFHVFRNAVGGAFFTTKGGF